MYGQRYHNMNEKFTCLIGQWRTCSVKIVRFPCNYCGCCTSWQKKQAKMHKQAISSFAVINALCCQHVSSYIAALHTLKDDNYHTHMLVQQ